MRKYFILALLMLLPQLLLPQMAGAFPNITSSQVFVDGMVIDASDLNGMETQRNNYINNTLLAGAGVFTVDNADSLVINGRGVADTFRVTGIYIVESHFRASGSKLYSLFDDINPADSLYAEHVSVDTISPLGAGSVHIEGGLIFNDDSADFDLRMETDNISNGFVLDAGLDVFSFGGAAADDQFITISPPAATHTATTNTYNLQVGSGGAQTIPTGTTTYVGTVNIDEPNITATGTVTNAFSLRVSGAPTEGGTGNYALWVDDGATQLDGALTVGGTLTATDISPTGTLTTTGNLNITQDNGTVTLNPDSLFYALKDSSLIETAHKIIYVDLTDQSQMWDLARFDAESKGTSWYDRGADTTSVFPRHSLIYITAGQDSVVIYDLDRSKEWMVFIVASNNIAHGSSWNDIVFLDGVLFGGGNAGLFRIDFIADAGFQYHDSGQNKYKGNIFQRNDTSGLGARGSLAIVNNTVNAISVIRDPEGAVDAIGRPKQIFVAGTDGGLSASDPGANFIWDSSITHDVDALALHPSGALSFSRDFPADRYYIWHHYNVTTITGDSWTSVFVHGNNQSGAADIPFVSASIVSDVEIIDASIAYDNSALILAAFDAGLFITHTKRDDDANGLSFILNDSLNAGPWSGTGSKHRNFPLRRGKGGIFSDPLTNNNAVTFSEANGADFVAASSMSLSEADGADYTFTTAFSAGLWFNRDIDSGGEEGLFGKYDDGTAADRTFKLMIGSADAITLNTVTAGPAFVASSGPAISTSQWYYVVATYDGANQRLYLDGEEVDSDAQTGNMIDAAEVAIIGGITTADSPANFFDGKIKDAFVMDRTLTPDEIRWLYQRGLRMRGTEEDYLASNDIDYVHADERSGTFSAGDEDTVVVLSPHLIPITGARYGVATANSDIQDGLHWTMAGSDSLFHAYGTSAGATAKLELSQPDPTVSGAGQDQQVEIVHKRADIGWFRGPSNLHLFDAVVDSAGNGDFTNVDDAIDSGALSIWIKKGTYPAFDADVADLFIMGASYASIIDGAGSDDSIDITANRVTITNLSAQTATGGAGGGHSAINVTGGVGTQIIGVYIPSTDFNAIEVTGASEGLVRDCIVEADHDTDAIFIDGPRWRVIGNFVAAGGGYEIYLESESDNSLVVANLSEGDIVIHAYGENSLAVANVTNEGVTDNSGTSTVASNEQY